MQTLKAPPNTKTTVDAVVKIKYRKKITGLNFDIKTYTNHYSVKSINPKGQKDDKKTTMGDLLNYTRDMTGDDASGRLLFANIVASRLASSLISPESNLHRLLYYWALLKGDGFKTLFGEVGTAAHFIIFANELKPLSFLMESMLKNTTKIAVNTTIEYKNYNEEMAAKDKEGITIIDRTLRAKQKFIKKGWVKHSKQSFDTLYADSEFFTANLDAVNALNRVILTQKRAKFTELS